MEIQKLNEWIKYKRENPEPDYKLLYKSIPVELSEQEFEKRAETIINKVFQKIILDSYEGKLKCERIGGYKTFKGEARLENALGEEVKLPVLARVSSEEDFGYFDQDFYYLHLGFNTKSVPTLSTANIRGELFSKFYNMVDKVLIPKSPINQSPDSL